jgi:hypothetical protein
VGSCIILKIIQVPSHSIIGWVPVLLKKVMNKKITKKKKNTYCRHKTQPLDNGGNHSHVLVQLVIKELVLFQREQPSISCSKIISFTLAIVLLYIPSQGKYLILG